MEPTKAPSTPPTPDAPGPRGLLERTEAWLFKVIYGRGEVPTDTAALVRELRDEVIALRHEPPQPLSPAIIEAARIEARDEIIEALRRKANGLRLKATSSPTVEEHERLESQARDLRNTAALVARWSERGPAPVSYPVALALIGEAMHSESIAGEQCNFEGDNAGLDRHIYAYDVLEQVARRLGREVPIAETRVHDDCAEAPDGR